MIEQNSHEEILFIIKEIETDPRATQRTLSSKLGISLGKTNYLLNQLIKKGFIKACHFSTTPGKIEKINYLLTKRGFEERFNLLKYFLKLKEEEFARLKVEWRRVAVKQGK